MRRIFLLWLTVGMIVQVAMVSRAVAQSAPNSALMTDSDIRNSLPRMEEVVQSFVSNKQFMGAVLVARGDQIFMNKGYGSANLEWEIPNSPFTKFRLGSLTKQFTAASILLLEERGKLNVADPVKKYLPDAPDAWDRITIFHLLTHTSGIPDFTSFPDYRSLEPFPATPEDLVARFVDKPSVKGAKAAGVMKLYPFSPSREAFFRHPSRLPR
jgi:CubicO group peptidase (beta-lactamase class C family)